MRALAPACPPNDRQSRTTTCRPSEAAYTAVAKPGRSGADDCNVEKLVARGGIEHAQAAGQRIFGRVAQHRAVGADHEDVGRGRAVLFEHTARRRPARRRQRDADAVSAQEILQAQQVGRLRLADQHRSAGAGLDERDPAQDQCADDAFAKVRFGDDQRAQLFRRHQ